jgi:hypothetical protein
MTNEEALNMVWHMANMWLCEETQRFQQHPVTNEWMDVIGDLLESHYPDNTELAAEEALRTIYDKSIRCPQCSCTELHNLPVPLRYSTQ